MKNEQILGNEKFIADRIIITKRILDDLKYEGFYDLTYLKCKHDTVSVYIQPNNKFLTDVFSKGHLAVSLRDELFKRYDITLSSLSEQLPIDTKLIVEYAMMNIKIRGENCPMMGVTLVRESEVYESITTIHAFQRHILRSIESQYHKFEES